MILGSVFSIIDSDATNWYQTASLLNGIFTTIFLVLLYFFLKKYFGIHVAFYSSFIISLLPYFIFQGSVVRPIILFLIFTVSSFYFLNHKKSHYVIFGILSALAHLTHPFGIILPLSYFTILIINKKFHGFFLTFALYQIVLIPWYLRSFYHFNDFGRGLLIPFSLDITNFLFPNPSTNFLIPHVIFKSKIEKNFFHFDLSSIIHQWYEYSNQLFHFEPYLIFILIFVSFAFFKINSLKQNIKILLPSIFGIFIVYVAILYYKDPFLSLFLIIIPIFIGSIILLKFKKHLEINNNRFASLILVYFTISFSLFYFWQLRVLDISKDFSFLEIRILMTSFIFLIPIAILGLFKINAEILNFKNNDSKKSILIFLIMGVIISPIIFISIDSNNLHPIFNDSNYFEPNNYKKNHTFVHNNYSENLLAMSNNPLFTYLRTGIYSIPTIEGIHAQESLISHYDISLLINYKNSIAAQNKNPQFNIDAWPNQFYFKNIKSTNTIDILEIYPLANYDLKDGDVKYILAKGIMLKKQNDDQGERIIVNLLNKSTYSESEINIICSGLINYHEFEKALIFCRDNITKDQLESFLYVHFKEIKPSILKDSVEIIIKVLTHNISDDYERLYTINQFYEVFHKTLPKVDPMVINELLYVKFELVDLLIEDKKYDKANVLLLEILNYDRLNLIALEKQLLIFEKTGNEIRYNELRELLEEINLK